MTFQSGRTRMRSLPWMPAIGMKGTPFCAASRPAWIAGQVASIRRIAPSRTAAEKRGAPPASPKRHGAGLDRPDEARADAAYPPAGR